MINHRQASGAKVIKVKINFDPLKKEHGLLHHLERKLSTALSPQSRRSIPDCFERLLSYMGMHFATEDRLMVQSDYPDAPAHRGEHDFALDTCRRLEREFLAGDRAAAEELLVFLKQWRNTHLPGADKRLVKYLSRWAKAARRAQDRPMVAEASETISGDPRSQTARA